MKHALDVKKIVGTEHQDGTHIVIMEFNGRHSTIRTIARMDPKRPLVYENIQWEMFENGSIFVHSRMVDIQEFFATLAKTNPEDLNWILFNPEVLSGKYNGPRL